MSDLNVPNIIYFQTGKFLNSLNNTGVLFKGVLIGLCARNLMHPKTSLRACCVHARHSAPNLHDEPYFNIALNFELNLTGPKIKPIYSIFS